MKPISATYLSKTYNPEIAEFFSKAAEKLDVKFYFQRSAMHRLGTFIANGYKTTSKIYVKPNLDEEHFLIILAHELAHASVWREYGNNAQAHGEKWKFAFKILLKILLQLYRFKPEWESEIYSQIESPKVTYERTSKILNADEKYIEDLADGAAFLWKDKTYKKLYKRRTRVLCVRLDDQKKYLFISKAIVKETTL